MNKFDTLVQTLLEAAGKDSPVGGMKDDNYELPKATKHWSYKTAGKGKSGSIRTPEGVKSTTQAIAKALETVDQTQRTALEGILKQYMTMYANFTARFAQFRDTEELLARKQQSLDKANKQRDTAAYEKLADQVSGLKIQARMQEEELRDIQAEMSEAQKESYAQIKELVGETDPTAAQALDRYYSTVEGRKKEAEGAGYGHLFHDIVKSVAEFLKNVRHSKEVKSQRVLSKYNIPEDYQALIKLVKRADPKDKDAALAFIANLPGDANPFKRALLNVELKKYYNALEQGDAPQQATLVKSIYSLAGQSA